MTRRIALAFAVLLLAACGTEVPETDLPDASVSTAPDAGTPPSVDAGTADAPDASTPQTLDAGADPTPDAGAPVSRFTAPPLVDHDVARGMKGLDVGQLQFELKLATGANLDEDGQFGPATQSLLNRFQRGEGFLQTDSADGATRATLQVRAGAAATALERDDEVPGPFEVPVAAVVAANLGTLAVVAGQGDKTSTYNGRVGFAWGDGGESDSIRQGSPAHLDWVATSGTSASERRVIGVISRNEGPFDAVNSYDAGNYTWGAYQLIGSYRASPYDPGEDELSQGLAAVKRLDPPAFFQAFQRFGFDVAATWTGELLVRSSVRPSLALPDGTTLSGKQVWERVGTDALYNQLFIDAGQEPRIQRGEVLAAKAVHFDALDLPLAAGRPAVRRYLTSERATCAFLDQELNRGRHGTLVLYAVAVDAVCADRGLDPVQPDGWPPGERGAIEGDVLAAVLARAPSTDYAARLRRVLASVFVADAPRSFVAAP